jgi:all-trans-retinol dehydrogenase (NAD+)
LKVTGGSNGLGQQISLQLASKGCHVIVADISSGDDTIEKLKAFNVKAKAYRVDVSSHKEITELKKQVNEEFGDVFILVNNAGLIPYKTVSELTYEEIEKLTSVNVNSVMFMTKCFLEDMMRNKSGHIVSISSLQGIYPFPHSINYSSTKFAVTGYMLALKEYLRRENFKNIFTTTIFPNVIATNRAVIETVNSSK